MEIITPIDLTMHSSNVTEALYSEYDYTGVTVYNPGDRVYVSYLSDGITEIFPHQIYEALVMTNDTYPPTNPTKWVYISSTNKWKMFDDYVNRQTESNAGVGYIEVEIDSSKCNRLGLANVDAGSVEVTVTDLAHGDVWEEDTDMFESSFSTSWSTYFFGEFTYKDYLVVNIPPFLSGTAKVKIIAKSSGGTAGCGTLRAGKAFYVGATKWDGMAGIIDYSKKDTNVYGETYLNVGSYAKRVEIDVKVNVASFSSIQRKLADSRAQAIFLNANNATTSQSAFMLYGFIREFQEFYRTCNVANCTMTAEGFI